MLSEEDENNAPLSTDDQRRDQRANFANAVVCVTHYSGSSQCEGLLVNADAFVYTLEPSALLHSTDCHSSILHLPIGYPKGLEEGSVSLWGMPTLLEHVPLKTVTKHSLISLIAGSVSKIMLTDIRTLRTSGIQTLDCNVTQDSYSYYMLLCIVIHYSSNTYIFKQQQQ